jgi:hypothetical protein
MDAIETEPRVVIHGIESVAGEDKQVIHECFTELSNLHGSASTDDGPRELQVRRTEAKTYMLYCYGFDEKITDVEMTKLLSRVPFNQVWLDWGYDPLATFKPNDYEYNGALVVFIVSKDFQRAQQRAKDARPLDFTGNLSLQSYLESGAMACFATT